MPETIAPDAKVREPRTGTADLQMLAQVEKWMAMIREINRERQDDVKLRS